MEEAIRAIPEVISCHYISGTGTFELQVVSRDLNSFSQFAREVLINLPNVKDLHTSFSLGEVKASSALAAGASVQQYRESTYWHAICCYHSHHYFFTQGVHHEAFRSAGFHPHRIDDRRRDHRYLGRRGPACVSGLHASAPARRKWFWPPAAPVPA
jgi:hypothetical protein